MNTIDISGTWEYRTHDSDTWRGGFALPGSTCGNGVGRKQEYYDMLTKESVRAPREKYEYIAPLYLRREIEIPADWKGKYISLYLERVNMASSAWLDGKKLGHKIVGLSTPHVYDLTGTEPGIHTLELCSDNRDVLNIDIMASGYSIDTQGYWNGIIGRMELRAEEMAHIGAVRVYPDERGVTVKVVEVSETYSPEHQTDCRVTISVTDPDGKELGERVFSKKLYNSHQPDYYRYDIDAPRFWDEFAPELYTLRVKYTCRGVTDEKKVRFGLRTIKSENKQLLLNGRELALRGTTNCAQFPLTGYPPTDKETWLWRMNTAKEYGFNHVRFHAWCPPEAAFEAADEAGIYISIEMPLWLNRDVCALEVGEDAMHRAYYADEAVRISDTYGNHPSFIMFSNGNENMGDFELLERITTMIKAYDPRRIYTITSNFDHPVLPCEDYLCAFDAGGEHIRIQNMQDEVAKDTCLDYSRAVQKTTVPIISFEVGQYCSYPDVDICERYTGNILPTNFDAIRKEMKRKGVYERLGDYVKASGDLAVKLYKEDMEAALRTKGFGGIELLSIDDYPGQSTATVGILDVFGKGKGFITPQKWREFCSEVVPLFKAKRIFKNTETLTAELDLYDHGREKIKEPLYEVRIYIGGKLFYSTDTHETTLSIPLRDIKKSSRLDVEVTVEGHKNTWRVYVFTEPETVKPLHIIRTKGELDDIIANGGRAVVGHELFPGKKEGGFIPVFWSPVHFPTPKPCGAIIDSSHPLLKTFPTEMYPDYQWKTLFDNSVNCDLTKLSHDVKPIIEIVPNFVDNTPVSPLFEARIGKAELLFCGFDLESDDVTVKCLKNAIAEYMAD